MHKGLQLRIQLDDIEPAIWRRIQVPADLNLFEIHIVFQAAVGWEHCHLHMFDIHGQRYEELDEEDPHSTENSLEEREYIIGNLVKKGDSLTYTYDFGDNWVHTVLVEDIVESEEPIPKRCFAGARAGPPEDCGGPHRYPDFLEAISSSDHPDHEEKRAWAGDFDPEEFDAGETTIEIETFWNFHQELEERDPQH